VLEQQSAVKIELAHGICQALHGLSRHRKGLPEFSERQMERLLVPVEELIEELAVFVVPEGKAESLPTARFVDEDLTRLESGVIAEAGSTYDLVDLREPRPDRTWRLSPYRCR
jgi:hypothetical protein